MYYIVLLNFIHTFVIYFINDYQTTSNYFEFSHFIITRSFISILFSFKFRNFIIYFLLFGFIEDLYIIFIAISKRVINNFIFISSHLKINFISFIFIFLNYTNFEFVIFMFTLF